MLAPWRQPSSPVFPPQLLMHNPLQCRVDALLPIDARVFQSHGGCITLLCKKFGKRHFVCAFMSCKGQRSLTTRVGGHKGPRKFREKPGSPQKTRVWEAEETRQRAWSWRKFWSKLKKQTSGQVVVLRGPCKSDPWDTVGEQ